MNYKVYGVNNFRKIPQVERYLSEEQRNDLEILSLIFPFKVNNYVIDELICWEDVPNDPMFRLCFPCKEMLKKDVYELLLKELKTSGNNSSTIKKLIHSIRMSLNPHPSDQTSLNVPTYNGKEIEGLQHKYKETVLFFPSQGQTCHAYCTFCFRWPQFIGDKDLKFSSRDLVLAMQYIKENKQISDVLFTGGDPMIMTSKVLRSYISILLGDDYKHIATIRFGSKSIGFWPYKFTGDKDADEILRLFEEIRKSGKHVAFMAHLSHPVELRTKVSKQAIERIISTGAVIRTQSPILKYINDSADVWKEMWQLQVQNNCIPYYMFISRDTGAQDYFSLPLIKTWEIFQQAYMQMSGIARSARGPSMSASPGKVLINGPSIIKGEKILSLSFIQSRNSNQVNKPFYAKYDENAIWFDQLVPAFGDKKWFWE